MSVVPTRYLYSPLKTKQNYDRLLRLDKPALFISLDVCSCYPAEVHSNVIYLCLSSFMITIRL